MTTAAGRECAQPSKSGNCGRHTRSGGTGAAELDCLADDADSGVRRTVAADPDCPPAALARLALSRYPEVRRAACRNPKRPGGVPAIPKKHRLMLDDSPAGRDAQKRAARESAAPPAVLDYLADAAGGGERVVAAHPDIPGGALARLAGDKSVDVRAVAAANPDIPGGALEKLAADPTPGSLGILTVAIPAYIAANPECPPGLLARLAGAQR